MPSIFYFVPPVRSNPVPCPRRQLCFSFYPYLPWQPLWGQHRLAAANDPEGQRGGWMTDWLPQQSVITWFHTLHWCKYLENGKGEEPYLWLADWISLSLCPLLGLVFISFRAADFSDWKKKDLWGLCSHCLKTRGRNTTQVQPTTVFINYLGEKIEALQFFFFLKVRQTQF